MPRAPGARSAAVLVLAAVVAAAPSVAHAIGLAEERDLGARFALEARVQLPLVRAPAVTGYLRDVGSRLIARLESERFPYRFYLVRDPSMNAFAVPGGYVYVHSGLVLGVASEAELAGVLAHELVHVASHHAVRQQEKTALISYGTLLGMFLSLVHPALGAGAIAAGAAAQLKYQREFEQEADTIGLGLMAPAGFDPAGMPAFLRRVLREQRLNPARVPPYFLSHPLTEDRVAALEQRLPGLPRPAPRAGGDLRLAAAQATIRALTEPADEVLPAYRAAVAAPSDAVASTAGGTAPKAGRTPARNVTGNAAPMAAATTAPRIAGAAAPPAAGSAARLAASAAHRLGLVYLYVDPSRPADAEPLLARAAKERLPGALGDLARAEARLGRADDARRDFDAAAREDPADASLVVELGKLALASGDDKRATALFAHALELDPELDDAEYGLAECDAKRGDARGQWTHLGRAFELRSDLARAKNAYERALELVPEDGPEREQLRAAIAAIGRVGTGW